ncbi:hypothetical protein [Bacillus sp. 3255]|uniref:hypothetical protein n=1 Tax=Bacillus sp. 3255 TaxID=2817904 RepID=UPI00285A494F|nr:hypothetical protein [Bacillus sp. 3255]MDR6884866.1 hypothetical protein [Bacillus sp. 3255]
MEKTVDWKKVHDLKHTTAAIWRNLDIACSLEGEGHMNRAIELVDSALEMYENLAGVFANDIRQA